MGRFALLLALGACRLGFDELEAPGDATGDGPPGDGAAGDGAADGSIDGPPAVCPGTYITVNGETSKYRIVNQSADWPAAEQACEADGTHLWIPDTAAELNAISFMLPAQNVWTGITDRRTIGQWLRVTGGTQTYLPWEIGEPDVQAAECVRLTGALLQIGDQGCSSGGRYACECDGAAADPSAY